MEIPVSASLKIDLVSAIHRLRPKPEYVCDSRDSDAFIYYIKGRQNFIFENSQSITATEGEVLYLPYKAKYKNKILDPDTEYYQIDFILYKNGIGEPLFDGPRHIKKPESMNYRDSIRRIRHNNYKFGDKGTFACFSDLCKLIDMITTRDDIENNYLLSRIRPSVDYIDQNYHLNTSIADIAAMSSMCATSLERIFKLCFHLSPNAYRNTVRINKSKHLLLAGLGIVEVAEQVGFYDSCHFSKTFKRIVGMSPGEFAKTGRQA